MTSSIDVLCISERVLMMNASCVEHLNKKEKFSFTYSSHCGRLKLLFCHGFYSM